MITVDIEDIRILEAYLEDGSSLGKLRATGKWGASKHSMNVHRIIATCQPENIPSYRVMEKIGMRREGFFKKCIPKGNVWWDEYYYAILYY